MISAGLTKEQIRAVSLSLDQMKLKYLSFDFCVYGITLSYRGVTYSSIVKKLPAVLDIVIDLLIENGASNKEYCPLCKEKLYDKPNLKAEIEGMKVSMHEECLENLNSEVEEENEIFESLPDNSMGGFLGALIGGAIGATLAFIFYLLGFISALAAIVSVATGIYFYTKLGGKAGKRMIITVALVTLFFILSTTLVVYILIAQGTVNDRAGIDAFMYCMKNSEFSSSFISDLVMSFIFIVLGFLVEIKNIKTKIAKEKEKAVQAYLDNKKDEE